MRVRTLAAIAMAIPAFSFHAAAQEAAPHDHAAHGAMPMDAPAPADHAAHGARKVIWKRGTRKWEVGMRNEFHAGRQFPVPSSALVTLL